MQSVAVLPYFASPRSNGMGCIIYENAGIDEYFSFSNWSEIHFSTDKPKKAQNWGSFVFSFHCDFFFLSLFFSFLLFSFFFFLFPKSLFRSAHLTTLNPPYPFSLLTHSIPFSLLPTANQASRRSNQWTIKHCSKDRPVLNFEFQQILRADASLTIWICDGGSWAESGLRRLGIDWTNIARNFGWWVLAGGATAGGSEVL